MVRVWGFQIIMTRGQLVIPNPNLGTRPSLQLCYIALTLGGRGGRDHVGAATLYMCVAVPVCSLKLYCLLEV